MGNGTLSIIVVKEPECFIYSKGDFLSSQTGDRLGPQSPTCVSIPYFLMKSCGLPIDFSVAGLGLPSVAFLQSSA